MPISRVRMRGFVALVTCLECSLEKAVHMIQIDKFVAYVRVSLFAASSAALLCIAACGSDSDGASKTQPVPCAGVSDCKQVGVARACSDGLATICHTALNECKYRLKNDPACPCVEGEVNICNLAAAGAGGTGGSG